MSEKAVASFDINLAAYGGEGWSPRLATHREEIGSLWTQCGINTEYGTLKRVLLHRPGAELAVEGDPNAAQLLTKVDAELAGKQHDGIAAAYRAAGAAVDYVEPAIFPTPNQMFVADLMFMTPAGAILARPASTVRAGEERWVARRLAELGIPIYRILHGNATFEGADAAWLDPETVIIGRGLRTNDAGAAQVANAVRELGAEPIVVDLPFGTMHLMGMLRLADKDLALGWGHRLAHRAVDALRTRGIKTHFLPDNMEASQSSAFNFVVLAPRKILMPANAPITQAFYENLGIECVTTPVHELRKAAGAIGCLSGIVEREMA